MAAVKTLFCKGSCRGIGTESIEGAFLASEMKVQLLGNEAAVPIPACGEKNRLQCTALSVLLFPHQGEL